MCEFEWPEGSPTHGDWRGNCADGGQSWAAHILLSVCPVIPISANTQAGSEIMFRESSQKALFLFKAPLHGRILQSTRPRTHETTRRKPQDLNKQL